MSTNCNPKTHPGNTELTTIRKVEIDVHGTHVMVDVEIPIPLRGVCENCGTTVQWSKKEDADGTVVLEISDVGCDCFCRDGGSK